jgi:hypothetical protein
MNFLAGLLLGLILSNSPKKCKRGGMWLETRGSHETDPFTYDRPEPTTKPPTKRKKSNNDSSK